MKRLRHQHSGKVLLLSVFSMVALIGIAGLAVDIGLLYSTRRQMQTAADAAGIAGANALQTSQSQNYKLAAADVAGLNGFTNGQSGVTVRVAPPATPPGPASLSYVQVDITQQVPTYFLRVLGYNKIKMSTEAIAGTVNGPACIYALDPSASGAVSLTGKININSSCGLVDDSNSSSALSATGNITVQTTATGITGNYSSTGNITFSPTPKIHIAPVPDPLAALQPPSVGTCTQAAITNSGSKSYSGNITSLTLNPVAYSGGISVSGNLGNMTFNAGTYGNGINFNGDGGNLLFNPGQYQNGGGSGASITLKWKHGNHVCCRIVYVLPPGFDHWQQCSHYAAGSQMLVSQ
jgi:Flp pilus assembly protein TadG